MSLTEGREGCHCIGPDMVCTLIGKVCPARLVGLEMNLLDLAGHCQRHEGAGVAALLFGLVFLHGFPMLQRPTWLRDGRPKDTKRHPTTLGSTLGIGCNKV